MANFIEQDLGDGTRACHVDPVFRPVGRWCSHPERGVGVQFFLRLAVGPADETLLYKKDSTQVLLGRSIEDDFLFDTSATTTLISGRIARRLKLPLLGAIKVERAGDFASLCLASEVSLNLGGNWFVVPCLVPYPVDPSAQVVNLLGMRGLLDEHIFCLARDELVAFRRRGWIGDQSTNKRP
jgi:hypothetical protein